MQAIRDAEIHDLEYDVSAKALREGISTFSQAISSQRKRKRGVSSIYQSDDDTVGSKLDIEDLSTIAGSSRLQSSLKRLVDDAGVEDSLVSNPHQKLSAPIPHAIQARLDRQEAYSTTKHTLNKWLDAVKLTRNAEQLIFPLQGGSTRSLRNRRPYSSHQRGEGNTELLSKLEDRVSKALSLATQRLESNVNAHGSKTLTKSNASHTRAYTAHLRMERELLLRREAKAKRLRKIKSKSYRRLLRKDQQKITEQNSTHDDDDVSIGKEEERERDGARASVLLDNSSRMTLENSDIQASLKIGERMLSSSRNDENIPGRRLFAMKFMEDAERRASIKKQASEVSVEHEIRGRRVFHDGKFVDRLERIESVPTTARTAKLTHNSQNVHPRPNLSAEIINPWLRPEPTSCADELEAIPSILPKPQASGGEKATFVAKRNSGLASPPPDAPFKFIDGKGDLAGFLPALSASDDSSPGTLRNEQPELLVRAFAGDNVLSEIVEQSAKSSSAPERGASSNLPGWGSWSSSTSAAGKAHKQNRSSRNQSSSCRNKCEKVIVNQKLCKKGSKYLATQVPHPFETFDQYERSLRFPIGQEWSTKQTHQTLSAPKVIVRGGVVISPLS